MASGRISDWIEKFPELNKKFNYKDTKLEDQKKLRAMKLPVPESLRLNINELNNHGKLDNFFLRNKGVFLRVVPNEEGLNKGLKKRFNFGFLSQADCLNFISKVLEESPLYSVVEFQEWEPTKYGWIIISDGAHTIGEIAADLDKLSHYNQEPLSSISVEIDDYFKKKVTWLKKEHDSAISLLSAIRFIETKSYPDFFLQGYFEGITTISGKIIFFDMKSQDFYYNI